MKGLTAKVWRTYNASYLFQKELDRVNIDKIGSKNPFNNENEKINYLMMMFNLANSAVAILCNHQKTVSGDIDKKLKLIDDKITELKKKKKKIQDKIGKKGKTELIEKISNKIKILKIKKDNKIIWFWIGSHADYNHLYQYCYDTNSINIQIS